MLFHFLIFNWKCKATEYFEFFLEKIRLFSKQVTFIKCFSYKKLFFSKER